MFKVDKFTDVKGDVRNFVICAVSTPVENLDFYIGQANWNELSPETKKFLFTDCTKFLSLGIAICAPADEFNEEIGKHIAEGRARKYSDRVMAVSMPGMINTKVVEALLQQEAEYLKEHPECYIVGYKK